MTQNFNISGIREFRLVHVFYPGSFNNSEQHGDGASAEGKEKASQAGPLNVQKITNAFGAQTKEAASALNEKLKDEENPKSILEMILRFLIKILSGINHPNLSKKPEGREVMHSIDGLTDRERDLLREYSERKQVLEGNLTFAGFIKEKESTLHTLAEEIDENFVKLGTVSELARKRDEIVEDIATLKRLRNKRERQCEMANDLILKNTKDIHPNLRGVEKFFTLSGDLRILISRDMINHISETKIFGEGHRFATLTIGAVNLRVKNVGGDMFELVD